MKLIDVLTPQKVLDIYKETGLRPAFGGFYPEGTAPKDCYCPMGAFAMAKDPSVLDILPKMDLADPAPGVVESIAELLGIEDDSEIWEFIDAFDGSSPKNKNEEPSLAYLLGRDTRNLLQIHYGPLVDLSTFPLAVDED